LIVSITEIDVEVVTTECLGPCELGDVVVVMPTKQERLMGHRPIWFGGMHSVVLTNLLIQWLITDYPKNQERYPELMELKIKTRKQNIKELEIYEINAK
jgi:(2Fe-2S) ferredoxin